MLISCFEYIRKLMDESVILSYFSNYAKLQNKYSNSLISGKLSFLSKAKFYILKFKVSCAEKTQNSIIVTFFKNVKNIFLTTSFTTFGIFALSYGLFMILNAIAKNTEKIFSLEYTDSFIFGIALCVTSFFLIPFTKKTISNTISDSKFCSGFIFEFFLMDFSSTSPEKPIHALGFAFVSGIVCGIVSVIYSPLLILFIAILISILFIVFNKPENGLMLICLALPFCNDAVLAFFVIITALSDLFKIMRGKRAFRSNMCSGALLLLLLIAISSCLFSYDSANAIFAITPVVVSIILGFLVITLVNSSRLSQKYCKALAFSAMLSAVFAFSKIILANLFSHDLYDIINILLSTEISSSFKSSEFFAAYIIALIPIVLIRFNTNSKGVITFIATAFLIICLALTNSYYAVVSLVLAFIISMLIFNKYGIFKIMFLALALPAFKYITELTSNNLFSKYLDGFSVTRQAVVSESTYGLSEFLSQFWISGAGAGSDSVAYAASAYSDFNSYISAAGSSFITLTLKIGVPLTLICIILISVFFSRIVSYALSKNNSMQAKSICTAIFCSLTALMIYAAFSNYINNIKILSLFFLIASLGSATADSAENDYISPSQVRELMFYQ